MHTFAGCGFVTTSVSLVDMRNFGHERIVWVGIRQHGADTQKHYGTRQKMITGGVSQLTHPLRLSVPETIDLARYRDRWIHSS